MLNYEQTTKICGGWRYKNGQCAKTAHTQNAIYCYEWTLWA